MWIFTPENLAVAADIAVVFTSIIALIAYLVLSKAYDKLMNCLGNTKAVFLNKISIRMFELKEFFRSKENPNV